MPFTPGLDRLAAMQQNPMGTFSSLRRASPVASQYKKQSQMYGQALRNLSRAARRGNTDAAIESLNLRDAANMQGFTPGGIQRAENEQVAIAGREQALMGAEADMRAATTLDRRNSLGALGRPSAPKSFAEIDAEARNRSTMSGAFGTGALNQALDTKRADSDRRAAISRNMEMPQGLRFREDAPASNTFTSNVAPGPVVGNPAERPLSRDSITDLGNVMRERNAARDFNELTPAAETPQSETPNLERMNRAAAMNFSRPGARGFSDTMNRVKSEVTKTDEIDALARQSLTMKPTEISKLPYDVLKRREELLAKK